MQQDGMRKKHVGKYIRGCILALGLDYVHYFIKIKDAVNGSMMMVYYQPEVMTKLILCS